MAVWLYKIYIMSIHGSGSFGQGLSYRRPGMRRLSNTDSIMRALLALMNATQSHLNLDDLAASSSKQQSNHISSFQLRHFVDGFHCLICVFSSSCIMITSIFPAKNPNWHIVYKCLGVFHVICPLFYPDKCLGRIPHKVESTPETTDSSKRPPTMMVDGQYN